ncbi:MAG: glycoside hydrolase family 38 [Anaerolineaceae bacterium]|nr:glycoside hydrolase family 38 [Anaerolineaceae bacterium]
MSKPITQTTIHLIPNAHLDPVWLWDWREGFTEGITTSRTILDLMDEFPELTFIRGEAFIYRYIEEADPETFNRIRQKIKEGRWDVVGGTMLQPDMNMPATETMLRQLLYAQRYFQSRFGLHARAGWSADCFGHSAALPDLLAAGGLEYYAYTRPQHIPPVNTFWWDGPAGSRLLVHHPTLGWYGTERDELPHRLDQLLEQAEAGKAAGASRQNIACFMGLGDHGGHPTRRMIAEARQWAEIHPDIRLIYSSLTGFFDALRAEVNAEEGETIPVFKGEINFAPRGIYASGARFKFAYRKAEAAVSRAERISSGVTAATTSDGVTGSKPVDLRDAWEALLFNTFHDIMPGSSIERAYTEQFDWLGTAPHLARIAEQRAINVLATRVDTRVKTPAVDMPSGVPFLAFNPHPWPFQGFVEVEAGLDYRPIWKYRDHPQDLPVVVRADQNIPLPLQMIETENLYLPPIHLRTRVVIPLSLPAFGWKVLEYAYEEGAPIVSVPDPLIIGTDSIGNGKWEIKARVGDEGVQIFHIGKPILDLPGLAVLTVEDPWGTWGDFNDSPESLSLTKVRHKWKVTRMDVGERGPLRATLNVRLEAGQSRIDFGFALCKDRDVVDVSVRVYWDESRARLKISLPGDFHTATYAVLGGKVQRQAVGEVPGGRWVMLEGEKGQLGFASDAIYGFNLTPEGSFHATIARASLYAIDHAATPEAYPWRPVQDIGEMRFNFLLTTQIDALPCLAAELEQPILLAPVTPTSGNWQRTGSLLSIDPVTVNLLALKPAEDGVGWILRIQGSANNRVTPSLTLFGQHIILPDLEPFALATFRCQQQENERWIAVPCSLLELM